MAVYIVLQNPYIVGMWKRNNFICEIATTAMARQMTQKVFLNDALTPYAMLNVNMALNLDPNIVYCHLESDKTQPRAI